MAAVQKGRIGVRRSLMAASLLAAGVLLFDCRNATQQKGDGTQAATIVTKKSECDPLSAPIMDRMKSRIARAISECDEGKKVRPGVGVPVRITLSIENGRPVADGASVFYSSGGQGTLDTDKIVRAADRGLEGMTFNGVSSDCLEPVVVTVSR